MHRSSNLPFLLEAHVRVPVERLAGRHLVRVLSADLPVAPDESENDTAGAHFLERDRDGVPDRLVIEDEHRALGNGGDLPAPENDAEVVPGRGRHLTAGVKCFAWHWKSPFRQARA